MYKITIEETKEVRSAIGRRWEAIHKNADGSVEYGYAPETETVVVTRTDIYTQVVEKLDVFSVIRAVNNEVTKP